MTAGRPRQQVDLVRLKKLWLSGMRADVIAVQMGVSRSTIMRRAQELGLGETPPPAIPPMPPL